MTKNDYLTQRKVYRKAWNKNGLNIFSSEKYMEEASRLNKAYPEAAKCNYISYIRPTSVKIWLHLDK